MAEFGDETRQRLEELLNQMMNASDPDEIRETVLSIKQIFTDNSNINGALACEQVLRYDRERQWLYFRTIRMIQ